MHLDTPSLEKRLDDGLSGNESANIAGIRQKMLVDLNPGIQRS